MALSAAAVAGTDPERLVLSLAEGSVYAGDLVTVSYADPTTGDDANAIQGLGGTDTPSFTHLLVDNAPALQQATFEPASQVLALSFDIALDARHLPDASAFTLRVDGMPLTAARVASVALSTDHPNELLLGLSGAAVSAGSCLTVDYADPSVGDDLSALQNPAGFDAASFAGVLIDFGGEDIASAAGLRLRGKAGSDVLSGGAGADRLFGAAGSDSLYGGAGTDTLFGGTGDDTLKGSGGYDHLLGGEGRDTLAGGRGMNALYGGDGADTLHGGLGWDTLFGGADDDQLAGGKGLDRYVYTSAHLGQGDLAGGAHDTLQDTGRNWLELSKEALAEVRVNGVALGQAGQDAAIGGTLDAGNSMALVDGALLFDVNGDGRFEAETDFAIDLVGIAQATYVAEKGAFLLS